MPTDWWVVEYSPSQHAAHVEALHDAVMTTRRLILNGALAPTVDGRPDYFIVGVYPSEQEAFRACRRFMRQFDVVSPNGA